MGRNIPTLPLYYSDENLQDISNGIWVEGAGVMMNMAHAYLTERRDNRIGAASNQTLIQNRETIISNLRGLVTALRKQLADAKAAKTVVIDGYSNLAVENMAYAGNFRIAAEADYILGLAKSGVTGKFTVTVTKTRRGGGENQVTFDTLAEALAYMEGFLS